MSKKSETHELHDKAKKEPVEPAGKIHLKVLADLFTAYAVYYQGETVVVADVEIARLMISEHAGYFEVVPDDQEAS